MDKELSKEELIEQDFQKIMHIIEVFEAHHHLYEAVRRKNNMGVWSNGRASGSNPEDVGSIPTAPAK